MRQQQLIEARRERREELRNQVQQLEKQVYRYQLKTSGRSGISLARINPFETRSEAGHTVLPSARTDHRLPESNESLIERLVQQNEHIMALLLPRRHEVVRNMINSESVAQHAPDKSPDVNKLCQKHKKRHLVRSLYRRSKCQQLYPGFLILNGRMKMNWYDTR
ncbi:uncharacterized protein IUM83_00901 [Phytophthora cinnamomi]|uniref:uncharacterized protein n=1 Tax=Phytophthora cinnamomi TaxID=4785 RepID=UPI003559CDB3|nr:hypothetical protein IUM83_00901 [Phytophthora cinnamomi]